MYRRNKTNGTCKACYGHGPFIERTTGTVPFRLVLGKDSPAVDSESLRGHAENDPNGSELNTPVNHVCVSS